MARAVFDSARTPAIEESGPLNMDLIEKDIAEFLCSRFTVIKKL
jgi:hypothetical protein